MCVRIAPFAYRTDDRTDRWSCDIGLNLDYQTFTAPKTGTLKEIAFPVGANGVNGPLNVQIFRFANDAALFAPSSPYTVLKPDQSFAANTLGAGDGRLGNGKNLIVPANVAVKAGDRIGFRIANGGTVPYCVFRQSTGAPRSSRLFLNGLNQVHSVHSSPTRVIAETNAQVSGRGRGGQASPVFSFANSSIKFYVNII